MMYREVTLLIPKDAYTRANALWDKLKGLEPASYHGTTTDALLYALALGLTALDREADRLTAPTIITPAPSYGKLAEALRG